MGFLHAEGKFGGKDIRNNRKAHFELVCEPCAADDCNKIQCAERHVEQNGLELNDDAVSGLSMKIDRVEPVLTES